MFGTAWHTIRVLGNILNIEVRLKHSKLVQWLDHGACDPAMSRYFLVANNSLLCSVGTLQTNLFASTTEDDRGDGPFRFHAVIYMASLRYPFTESTEIHALFTSLHQPFTKCNLCSPILAPQIVNTVTYFFSIWGYLIVRNLNRNFFFFDFEIN